MFLHHQLAAAAARAGFTAGRVGQSSSRCLYANRLAVRVRWSDQRTNGYEGWDCSNVIAICRGLWFIKQKLEGEIPCIGMR